MQGCRHQSDSVGGTKEMIAFNLFAVAAAIGISATICAVGVVMAGAWSDEGGPNAGGE